MLQPGFYGFDDNYPITSDEEGEFSNNYHDDDDDDDHEDDIDPEADVRRVRFLKLITENGFITEPRKTLTREEVQQLISGDPNTTRTDYQALNEKMSQLFNDETSSDVIIQTNGVQLHAHQLILKMWSDAFENLLEEPDTSGASIETCSKYTLSLHGDQVDETVSDYFFKFMYHGSVTIDIDHIWKLVSLAERYSVGDLKNACNTALLRHINNSPMNEQLIQLLDRAETWKMKELHKAIMLKLLNNFYFFSDRLLPNLSEDKLCRLLESSDLVAENEYKLLKLLLPRLRKLHNSGNNTSLLKILNLVRFTEMSGKQLNELKQDKLMKPLIQKLNEATFNRCLLWEGHESFVESKGQRLYLNPPLPYVEIKDEKPSLLSNSFLPMWNGDWKYCTQITLEPYPERGWGLPPTILPMTDIADKGFYYIQRNKSPLQRTQWYGPGVEQLHFTLQNNELLVKIQLSKPNRKVRFPSDRKASMIIIIHDSSKNCMSPVLSVEVSAKVDFKNNEIQFTEDIEFNSGLVMPLSQEIYVTLFAFIPLD